MRYACCFRHGTIVQVFGTIRQATFYHFNYFCVTIFENVLDTLKKLYNTFNVPNVLPI